MTEILSFTKESIFFALACKRKLRWRFLLLTRATSQSLCLHKALATAAKTMRNSQSVFLMVALACKRGGNDYGKQLLQRLQLTGSSVGRKRHISANFRMPFFPVSDVQSVYRSDRRIFGENRYILCMERVRCFIYGISWKACVCRRCGESTVYQRLPRGCTYGSGRTVLQGLPGRQRR